MAQTLQKTSITTCIVNENSIAELPSRHNNRFTAMPNDMGLVALTSGSTGAPKGIVQDHRAYCTTAAAHYKAVACPALRSSQLRYYPSGNTEYTHGRSMYLHPIG